MLLYIDSHCCHGPESSSLAAAHPELVMNRVILLRQTAVALVLSPVPVLPEYDATIKIYV